MRRVRLSHVLVSDTSKYNNCVMFLNARYITWRVAPTSSLLLPNLNTKQV